MMTTTEDGDAVCHGGCAKWLGWRERNIASFLPFLPSEFLPPPFPLTLQESDFIGGRLEQSAE